MEPPEANALLRGHTGISPYPSALFLLRHVCGTRAGPGRLRGLRTTGVSFLDAPEWRADTLSRSAPRSSGSGQRPGFIFRAMPEPPPPRPRPTRVVLFIDCQNLYNRCMDRFGWPWVHPIRLGKELVDADVQKYGQGSHCLTGVRYYTGIHDPNRHPEYHGKDGPTTAGVRRSWRADLSDPGPL